MSQQSNPWIKPVTTKIYSFTATETINNLTGPQKVNQQVKLSFFGNKIDLPFKIFKEMKNFQMKTDIAVITDSAREVVESYKIEIDHPLGKMFFRLDVPKEVTASQMTADAFSLANLNMRSKREFEDYLISRKQYDLDFAGMDVSHRQARLALKYEKIANWINLFVGTASAVGSIAKFGLSALNEVGLGAGRNVQRGMTFNSVLYGPKTGKPVASVNNTTLAQSGAPAGGPPNAVPGAIPSYLLRGLSGGEFLTRQGLSAPLGLTRSIVGLASASERSALLEEKIGLQIREKALESYAIDLSFERAKDEQLFTMRRIFANDSFNDVSSRQRQKLLDKLEEEEVEDIYLELWTTSGDQENYVTDYHGKYGVECRVPNYSIDVKDEMPLGILCIEDVVITNLADRIEIAFLSARLTNGIRFVEWQEHEQGKDLHPIDKQVLALQRELTLEKKKVQSCEEEKVNLNATIEDRDKSISTLTGEKEGLEEKLNNEVEKYHMLSLSFREKEGALAEQTKLANLYRDEATNLKKDLLAESAKHSSEKEGHTDTKGKLDDKTKEVETLTKQVDEQLITIEANKKTIEQNTQLLAQKDEELKEAKNKLQEVQAEITELKKKKPIPEPTSGDDSIEGLYKQIDEKNKQLEAIREIEKSLREEKDKYKGQLTRYQKKNRFKKTFEDFCFLLMGNSGQDEYNTERTRYFLELEGTNKFYEMCMFSKTKKCLISNTSWQQGQIRGYGSYRVWRYWGKKTGANAEGELITTDENVEIRDYYKAYGGYFDEPYTNWEQLKRGTGGKQMAPFKTANVNTFVMRFFNKDTCIPFFYVGYGGRAGSDEWLVGNTKTIYFVMGQKKFTYKQPSGKEGRTWMIIRNYGDYKKAMGMAGENLYDASMVG